MNLATPSRTMVTRATGESIVLNSLRGATTATQGTQSASTRRDLGRTGNPEVKIVKGIPNEAQERLLEQLAAWQLPAECLTDLTEHSHCISYAPGAPIFLKGSTADVIFWVLTGLVKVSYPNTDGTRVVVKLAGPGDVIGFADTVDSAGRHTQAFEAEAVTKSSVALFTRDHVIRTLHRLSPLKLVSLIESLNSSWSAMNSFYARFLGLSFRERLEIIFAQLAERFGAKDSRGVLLTPELSHDALAEMIASSRPMVSRLIAEMVDQRVIARQGKHYILLDVSTPVPNKTPVTSLRTACVPTTNSFRATLDPRPALHLAEA
jgi:CRP/FNR family transcriptional regulator, cyclic AMP receptor protein